MKETIFANDRIKIDDRNNILGNSSGMILSIEDDIISIGYIDYNVSFFGDKDYECFYELDLVNSNLFKEKLSEKYTGDLYDMCVSAFTIKFSNTKFEKFCAENNILYSKNTY